MVFRTSGWSAQLRPSDDEGPKGINPFILYVDLVISPPSSDTGDSEVLTAIELEELVIENPALEYREVGFNVVGTDDEPPARLTVEHLNRAGRPKDL